MLTLSGITKAYGGRTLFSDVTLQVNRQDRIGLVGPNGAGKTTLFSLVLGENSPDDGKILKERNVSFGYLPQESAPAGDETVIELATSISPEFVKLLPDQQAASRQDNYVWGLERCFFGCASEGPTFTEGQFVAHIFRYEGDDMESTIRALAGENATPEMIYAGELVAVLRVLVGDVNVNLQSRPWGQGAMVFRVSSREGALKWLSDPTFLQFRTQTAEDVIVLLEAGA